MRGPYSPQGPPTPSGQYSPANYSPRPQYAPSYAMQPPYPPTWPAQQPLSPMPKQLSMPPPMSPNPVLAQPTRHVERSNPPPHPPSPAKSPLPPAAEPEPEPLSQPAADSYVGTVQTTQNSSPSPARKSTFSKGEYVIWSRRPHDPANAPGIIISPLARPPKDVTESAMDLPSPPPTPSPSPPVVLREPSVVQTEIKEPDSSPEAADIQSSSATDTTPACSTAPETPTPASPLSTNTSLSAAPSAAKPVAPAASTPINALPASPLPTVKPAVKAPPKSWASLLKPSASTSSKSTLPTSAVVGISIPAHSPFSGQSSAVPSASHTPGPASPIHKSELLALLTTGPATSPSAPRIRPRGLINTGNMCFANAVLQILIYCAPFNALFSELGHHLVGPVVGKVASKGTPLVDATVEFLKEFEYSGKANGSGK
ncbi:hypothetical protein HWV62_44911, partial [Athelia sp. TMB]